MDDVKRVKSFVNLLARLQTSGRLEPGDSRAIKQLAPLETARVEIPLPTEAQKPHSVQQFLQQSYLDVNGFPHAIPCFRTANEGLTSIGWSEMPYRAKQLGYGAFGTVRLAFHLADVDLPVEKRRFCAIKAQKFSFQLASGKVVLKLLAWTEVSVLRAVSHPNICHYFGHFVVDPKKEETQSRSRMSGLAPDRQELDPPSEQLFMALEFANAGDLYVEMNRYDKGVIPEPGARYYLNEMCSGVQYLHSKNISHNDLHTGNVLLKYNPDGFTKKILIVDFGLCVMVSHPEEQWRRTPFAGDVSNIVELAREMLTGTADVDWRTVPPLTPNSSPRDKLLRGHIPHTVPLLLQYEWFRGESTAPIPGKVMKPLFEKPAPPAPTPRLKSPLLKTDPRYPPKTHYLSHLHPVRDARDVQAYHPTSGQTAAAIEQSQSKSRSRELLPRRPTEMATEKSDEPKACGSKRSHEEQEPSVSKKKPI